MPWYEDSFGADYLALYAHRDLAEARANARAVLALLSPPRDEPLLDLCCGAGRMLVALRELGFTRLVGLDLSSDLLSVAAADLERAGVAEVATVEPGQTPPPWPDDGRVVLVRSDMRCIPYEGYFATVLSIFTSFGYFESDDDNRAVLDAAYRALRPGGAFLMDYLNRDRVVAGLVPDDERRTGEWHVRNQRRITPDGRRVEKTTTVTDGRGRTRRFLESVRMYSEPEMRRMLHDAGFAEARAYGSFAGEPFGPESERLILLARKGGGG